MSRRQASFFLGVYAGVAALYLGQQAAKVLRRIDKVATAVERLDSQAPRVIRKAE